MTEITNLKPCPFCGGEATLCSVVSMQHEICYVVKCDDLNCIMCAGGTLRKTISQAIEAWNRRDGEEDENGVQRKKVLTDGC